MAHDDIYPASLATELDIKKNTYNKSEQSSIEKEMQTIKGQQ